MPDPLNKFKIITIGNATTGKSSLLVRYIDGVFQEDIISTIGVDFKYKDLSITALPPTRPFASIASSYSLSQNSEEEFLSSASAKLSSEYKSLKSPNPIYLQIWDTAGQEIYRTVTKAYYRGSDAVLFVFDISNRESFEALEDWVSEVAEVLKEVMHSAEQPNGTIRLYLVGNKKDLDAERAVSREEGVAMAKRIFFGSFDKEAKGGNEKMFEVERSYFEVSAKTGEGVEELFGTVTENLLVDKVMLRKEKRKKESDGASIELEEESGKGDFCGCWGGSKKVEEESEGESESLNESRSEGESGESEESEKSLRKKGGGAEDSRESESSGESEGSEERED